MHLHSHYVFIEKVISVDNIWNQEYYSLSDV